MKQWIEPVPVSVPPELVAAVGGHPIIARHLVRLGIDTPQVAERFLNPAAYTPTAPDALPDMAKAVERIHQAIDKGERILIWGDFDVDGQTSTALLVSALRELGASVQYHIPNRFTEGHGIHIPTLQDWLSQGIELMITCDTGITAHEAIDLANQHGVDVIITDHHSLAPTLPDAYAAINPMRLDAGHPLRELPGVGTAYKLIQALYGDQSSEHLLDLVALGIVADVMVQVDDTRYLLQRGLEVLRDTPRAGLRALIERAEVQASELNEMDIGFSIAPRLNALGRLSDAGQSVELLTTSDSSIIAERITELEGLNQKRRFLTRQVYQAAQQQLQEDPSLLKYAVLVIAGSGWHTGVVGIVASRLAEDYNAPVIILSENDGVLSGSARSVDGVNIVEAIRAQAHLLESYGGHNMAAGLRMNAENLFEFRRGISKTVREQTNIADIQPQIQIDGYLDFDEISLELADDISRLAPFGNGNPPLTLATRNVTVKSRRTMGSRGDHLDLRLVDESGNEQRVIWWFGDMDAIPQGQFDMAYTLRSNMFKGKREALVEWLDARPIEGQPTWDSHTASYEIVDYRQATDKDDELLQALKQQYPDAIIYAEGDTSIGANRYSLAIAETFIVWTIPPSAAVWRSMLDVVQPQRLILVGQSTAYTTRLELAQLILGMGKYALKEKSGIMTLEDVINLTAARDDAIRVALATLSRTSPLHFQQFTDDAYQVTPQQVNPAQDVNVYQHRWQALMQETRAYHHYWLTVAQP